MARKGILSPTLAAVAPRRTGPQGAQGAKPAGAGSTAGSTGTPAPRGAVGALQSSLSKLQENAVQEIAADRIFDAGMQDRLGPDAESDDALRESLRAHGQQVPVLVRPRAGHPGSYEIVYGRRRVQALRALGLPVKAMVRQLDDTALVLAQGQENTARRDLTFIEKASFAAQLDDLDYGRETICAALSIDQPMVSRMLKVGRAFSLDFLRQVGSAPGIGRDRWLKLVKALEQEGAVARVRERLPELAQIAGSDARFEQVLAWAENRAPAPDTAGGAPRPADKPRLRKVVSDAGYVIGQVRQAEAGLTLTIPAGDAPGFPAWVAEQGPDLVKALYARWLEETGPR